ncbi:hypothetical protein O1M63_02555 [Streptomyces mirabilis]|nr:hypothetical protein [Streptomyces mirabilis]
MTRRDLALNVMRDPATFTVDDPRFSTAQVVGPSMLSLDGDEHARHREPFTAPFRPREVRVGFASFIERETDRLITALEPAGAVELRRAFAGPLRRRRRDRGARAGSAPPRTRCSPGTTPSCGRSRTSPQDTRRHPRAPGVRAAEGRRRGH